jgi:hypothetical protein
VGDDLDADTNRAMRGMIAAALLAALVIVVLLYTLEVPPLAPGR